MARTVDKLLITGLWVAVLTGCIRSDRAECPPPVPVMKEVMIVTGVDIATNEDITISDMINDGTLFFFDDGLKLMDDGYTQVAKSALGVEKPFPDVIASNMKPGDQFWISAWGNIEGNFNVYAQPQWNDDISREFLTLIPDTDGDGYFDCPGEIMFGMRRIHLGEIDHPVFDRIDTLPDGSLKLVHEIQITQLNALLWIQVEGLPEGYDPGDYYFRVGRQNMGYNYEGAPFSGDELGYIVQSGVTDGPTGFFVTPAPMNLVPSLDPDNIDEETAVSIRLFQKAATRAEGDIDLTGRVTNVDYGDGDHIALRSQETTNVYIRFEDNGDITVMVKITPWGVIYNWGEWSR